MGIYMKRPATYCVRGIEVVDQNTLPYCPARVPVHCEVEWLIAARTAVPEKCCRERFFLEGLEVELRSIDPAPSRWVLKYLEPLSLMPPQDRQRIYTVTYLHSDEIVLAAIRSFDDFDIVPVRRHGHTRYVRRRKLSANTIVYCDPDEGIIWLSDLDINSIILIVSSRTMWPSVAFADVAIELVTRYLEEQDWTLFHAGAVHTERGTLMVVGYSGTGKTSLILALLAGGARFIANELLFVRSTALGVRVLGFPRAIAVGLGSAVQFPLLADLIDAPDELLFPRRRLNRSSIVGAPRSEWQHLEDKLQLLPSEISPRLNSPAAIAGGTLLAVVVPKIDKTLKRAMVESLNYESVYKIVSDNHLGLSENGRHRPWLEMNFRPESKNVQTTLLEELSGLSPIRFRFGFSEDSLAATHGYADQLLRAIK
jgi:hypothetical protein